MIEKVQYITQDNAQLSHSEQALMMFKNGIKWVQLRMKNTSEDVILAEAKKIMTYAEHYEGTLILNDSVKLAKELGVRIIHLGISDMPIDEARAILGPEVIIGGTANTFDQVKLQVERGADYVGVGPFRFTTTKKNLSPTLGLEGYKTLIDKMKACNIDIPLFAVGGVKLDDVEVLNAVGVNCFAISGDLLHSCLDGNMQAFQNLRTLKKL